METPDRNFLRTPLAKGSTVERVDLFLPEETGKYQVKVVVDLGDQGKAESAPVAFEVVLAPADEPLVSLLGGDAEALKWVGWYILYSHYSPGPRAESSNGVVGRNGAVLMKGIAPLIDEAEATAPTSRFLPYLQYAFVCNNASNTMSREDVTARVRRRAETLWKSTDPTFWLKPEVGFKLFHIYRALRFSEGFSEQARAVGEQMLQNWPQSAFVRNSALEAAMQALPTP